MLLFQDNQLKETLTPNTDVASQEHTVSSRFVFAVRPYKQFANTINIFKWIRHPKGAYNR